MASRAWLQAFLWLGIPALFAVFGKLTYWVVDSRIIQGFFPGQTYWGISIALHVALGLVVCLRLYGMRRAILAIGYALLMTVVLLAVQATVSCLSGDCI